MNQDRIGTILILIAAAWMAWLIYELPSLDVDVPWRRDMIIVTVALLVLAVFPRHIELTGTVLAFAVLGLCVHLALFERDGVGREAIVLVVLLAIALWFRRARLDLKDVVGVTALVACGIAIVQPAIVAFAFLFIGIVNVLLWLVSRFSSVRASS